MALFDVPGWKLSSDPTSLSNTRKRKRPGSSENVSLDKLQVAEVNVEKLLKTLGSGNDLPVAGSSKTEKKKIKLNDKKIWESSRKLENSGDAPDVKGNLGSSRAKHKKSKKAEKNRSSNPSVAQALPENRKDTQESGDEPPAVAARRSANNASQQVQARDGAHAKLTPLQSKMKQSLDGARFRWINETLYKSSSKDAEELMKENPDLFEEYHTGFRHQVASWPSKPLEHFKNELVSYPSHSVIVDLGCGDASLARDLIPKGLIVHSYDLVSANPFITAVDICAMLPLPGSEEKEEGQIVDVVVCSLSLMSTNWLNCIREARRVLRTRGELKIAEVASRIENVEIFTSVITSVGFRLVSKDKSNSHFTIFTFKKTGAAFDEKAWPSITSKGNVLQPCEYKKR